MGVEVRKKEVENRCFGRMHEGCAPPPPLGKRTMARRVGRGRGMVGGGSGEHKRKKTSVGNLRSTASLALFTLLTLI